MKIFLRGSKDRLNVMRQKIGDGHELLLVNNAEEQKTRHPFSFDMVIDLNLDEENKGLSEYQLPDGIMVIGCAVKKSLSQICNAVKTLPFHFMGINAFPGFLDKELLEISSFNENSEGAFKKIASAMNWKYKIVHDQVGMVNPRVICMIINEAFYALQDGVASREDIEKGMKLGTALPYGPFEWCDKIGIKNVYETLDALHGSTKDERYAICGVLKDHYLLAKTVHA